MLNATQQDFPLENCQRIYSEATVSFFFVCLSWFGNMRGLPCVTSECQTHKLVGEGKEKKMSEIVMM